MGSGISNSSLEKLKIFSQKHEALHWDIQIVRQAFSKFISKQYKKGRFGYEIDEEGFRDYFIPDWNNVQEDVMDVFHLFSPLKRSAYYRKKTASAMLIFSLLVLLARGTLYEKVLTAVSLFDARSGGTLTRDQVIIGFKTFSRLMYFILRQNVFPSDERQRWLCTIRRINEAKKPREVESILIVNCRDIAANLVEQFEMSSVVSLFALINTSDGQDWEERALTRTFKDTKSVPKKLVQIIKGRGQTALKQMHLSKFLSNVEKTIRDSLAILRSFAVARPWSDSKLHELRENFEKMDADGSGMLDRAEIIDFLSNKTDKDCPGKTAVLLCHDSDKLANVYDFQEFLFLYFPFSLPEERKYMLSRLNIHKRNWKMMVDRHQVKAFAKFWGAMFHYYEKKGVVPDTPIVRPEGIRASINDEKKIVDLRTALAVLRRIKGLSHWIDHWDRKSIFKMTGKVNKKTLLRSIFPELTRRNLITLQAWECEEPTLTPSQEEDCIALFERLADPDGKINYKTIVKFVGFPVEENLHSVSDKILMTLDPSKAGKISYDGFAAYYAKAWNINFFEALVGKVENMDL